MVNEQNATPSVVPAIPAAPVIEASQPTVDTKIDTSPSVSSEPVKQEEGFKSFTEDQMKVISADVKRRTEARVRAELEAQYRPQKAPEQPAEQYQASQPAIANYTEEQLYNSFRARQEKEQAELNQQNVANELLMKVQAAGLAQKIESSGIGNLPLNHPLVPMLNSLDNVADVIEEFDTNPVKVANLLAVTMLNPMNGFKELQSLSQSIKRNKEALAKAKAPEPQSQLKPSSYGLGGGASTVSDKRKNAAFRF